MPDHSDINSNAADGAMKLPRNCRFVDPREPFAFWSSDELDEMERTHCCRAHAWAEEPLCRFCHQETEGYRFLWDSSFDGSAEVHIGRKGERIVLRWDRRWYTDSTAPRSLTLSPADWGRLQQAISAVNFWSLAPTEERYGLDGADWVVQGHRGKRYHAIERWSPGGAIFDLGRLFFTLAGPPLAAVRLY
jgi:hypothetical protein